VALLLLVLKVALIAFVVGGTIALISRGGQALTSHRLDPRWQGHGAQPGYEASAFGAMPNTPLPAWAYRGDEADADHDNALTQRDLRPAQERAALLSRQALTSKCRAVARLGLSAYS
jgi:hypothetical protein